MSRPSHRTRSPRLFTTANPLLLPLILVIALSASYLVGSTSAAAPPPVGSPGSGNSDTYAFAEMVDGDSRGVIYLRLSFDTITTTIQATYKIFAALPAGPPVYITLANTTIPGCDPSRCSLPPAAPTWAQPVPSVWQAIGTFTSSAVTDPERYAALLQLIDNSSAFPGVVMAYGSNTQSGLHSAVGQFRVDTNLKFLEVGPVPVSVPNPNYVVRFRSYMPGGANLTFTQSADGLSFRVDVVFVVVVPTDEPFTSALRVYLQDSAPAPSPSDPACKNENKKKEKDSNKDKGKLRGADKEGKKGKKGDGCCDDSTPAPTISEAYVSLISRNGTCDYTCPSVFVVHGTNEWNYSWFTPEVRATISEFNALTALMQYAVTGVKGRLVNASMRIVSIDMPNGPVDLLERV